MPGQFLLEITQGFSFSAREAELIMKISFLFKCLLAVAIAAPLSGCLTQRTITEGGRTVKQEYVIKRPLKDGSR